MATKTKAHRLHWAWHHRILAAILIGLIVLAAGLLIAQDQETIQIKSPLAADDSRYPQYLANLLGHRLTSNDSYTVLTDGPQAFPAMRSEEHMSELQSHSFI